ncbi:hypothetical protein AB0M20_34135, partial [Actinoplanes sp. NPDC051633]|uniref:hypothetical protein n=1 Tax=Actinoplanes sp. NPDC051633 TaxID=3155670 RepID=UPI003441FE05
MQRLRCVRCKAPHEHTGGQDVVNKRRRLAGERKQFLQPVLGRGGSHIGAEPVRGSSRCRWVGVPPVDELRTLGSGDGWFSAR